MEKDDRVSRFLKRLLVYLAVFFLALVILSLLNFFFLSADLKEFILVFFLASFTIFSVCSIISSIEKIEEKIAKHEKAIKMIKSHKGRQLAPVSEVIDFGLSKYALVWDRDPSIVKAEIFYEIQFIKEEIEASLSWPFYKFLKKKI